MCVCTCVCVCVCLCVCTCVCVCVHTSVPACAFARACARIHSGVCACIPCRTCAQPARVRSAANSHNVSMRACVYVCACVRAGACAHARASLVRSYCVCEARPIRKAAPSPRPHKSVPYVHSRSRAIFNQLTCPTMRGPLRSSLKACPRDQNAPRGHAQASLLAWRAPHRQTYSNSTRVSPALALRQIRHKPCPA